MKFTRILSAVLLLGLAASARSEDVFNACSKDNTSKLRPSSILANAVPTCKTGETPRTWTSGIGTCAVEEVIATCQANTFALTNYTCSNGKTAVSASAIWHTPFDAADNGPFYFLVRSQFQWTIIPYNHTGVPQDYRFDVLCCSSS